MVGGCLSCQLVQTFLQCVFHMCPQSTSVSACIATLVAFELWQPAVLCEVLIMAGGCLSWQLGQTRAPI